VPTGDCILFPTFVLICIGLIFKDFIEISQGGVALEKITHLHWQVTSRRGKGVKIGLQLPWINKNEEKGAFFVMLSTNMAT
jgi:hypothetical protein